MKYETKERKMYEKKIKNAGRTVNTTLKEVEYIVKFAWMCNKRKRKVKNEDLHSHVKTPILRYRLSMCNFALVGLKIWMSYHGFAVRLETWR